MNDGRPIKIILGIILPIVILLGLAAYFVIERAKKSVSNLPVLDAVPQFSLTASDGGPFGLDDLKGKISIVDFIFTSCRGPCPMMSANMAGLYDQFKGHNEVQFVSISVDPDTDSANVLNAYAEGFGVTDKRWRFLTGDIADIAALCEGGFKLAADDLPGNHSTKFILVDDQARIRGYYDGRDASSMTILSTHIRNLARQFK